MKAAMLRSVPGELTIEDVQVDNPGPREVLIRTVAAGVCHSDRHYLTGDYDTPVPTVMGHESAGVVEAVGDQVTYVAPGDHVITSLSVFCGHCEYCLSGRMALCPHEDTMRPVGAPPRLSQDGQLIHQYADLSSFAELLLVHEHAVVKIRPDMPLDRATLIGCAVTTGLGAVFRTAAVTPGQTVAVIGCGGVGLSAIQGARIAGAGRIIGVDIAATKLDMAKRFGATDLVDGSAGDARRAGARAHGRRGRPRLRCDWATDDATAGLRDAATRRHRNDHRHDPARRHHRTARCRFPRRETHSGLMHG